MENNDSSVSEFTEPPGCVAPLIPVNRFAGRIRERSDADPMPDLRRDWSGRRSPSACRDQSSDGLAWQPDITSRQTAQITADFKTTTGRRALLIMPTTTSDFVKPDTGKIIKVLIGCNAIQNGLLLAGCHAQHSSFPRFERGNRCLHTAGAAVVTRFDDRKLSGGDAPLSAIHRSPVHRMRCS